MNANLLQTLGLRPGFLSSWVDYSQWLMEPVTGLVHALHLPISINAEVYMLPAFTMKSLLDTVVKYQLRELLLVPPILIRLVRDPLVDNYDFSCVRRFSTGAAPLSEEILHLLKKKFPQTEFKQGTSLNLAYCAPGLNIYSSIRYDRVLLLHYGPFT